MTDKFQKPKLQLYPKWNSSININSSNNPMEIAYMLKVLSNLNKWEKI